MSSRAVLITGASTGIGEACAKDLDARGYRVFAGVRKAADADRLSQAGSHRLTPVLLDVVDSESIAGAHGVVRDALGDGRLVGLVNNAGIGVGGPLEYVPIDRLRHQFEVNVFGVVAVTQRFLPMLREARGRVVNMSSIAGRTASPFLAPYAMSKFALEAFSDALRRELNPFGIEVSCVQPGVIETPIWDKAVKDVDEMRAELPPEATTLYGRAMDSVYGFLFRTGRQAIPASAVAEVVHHALTAKRPKTRYLVGRDAKFQAQLVRFLPDRFYDALVRRLFLRE